MRRHLIASIGDSAGSSPAASRMFFAHSRAAGGGPAEVDMPPKMLSNRRRGSSLSPKMIADNSLCMNSPSRSFESIAHLPSLRRLTMLATATLSPREEEHHQTHNRREDGEEPVRQHHEYSSGVYLRLSDESMIRLDMDRGVASSKYGHVRPVSWKRPAADVIAEVLTLVRGDDAAKPDSFPWEAYAEAAQLRGISVDAEALRDLPHTVLLSDELATIYEF